MNMQQNNNSNGTEKPLGPCFTGWQVRQALWQFAGVTIGAERLRQFRDGIAVARPRKSGAVYRLDVSPILQQGLHWRYIRGIVYTRAALEVLLARYDVTLTDDMAAWARSQPRSPTGHLRPIKPSIQQP